MMHLVNPLAHFLRPLMALRLPLVEHLECFGHPSSRMMIAYWAPRIASAHFDYCLTGFPHF